MTGRMIGMALSLVLLLTGCSREDKDLVSYIRIDRAEVSSGDTLALEAGAPDIGFAWSVVYTAPTSDYWMEILLADAEDNELLVFRQACDKRSPERYGCGASAEQICTPVTNGLSCNGQAVTLERPYDRVRFKACVIDAYDRPVCGIEDRPVELTGLDLPEAPETPPDTGQPPGGSGGGATDEPDDGGETPNEPGDGGNDSGGGTDEPDEEPGNGSGGGSGGGADDGDDSDSGSGGNPGSGDGEEEPGPGDDDGGPKEPDPGDDGEDDEDDDPWWRWDGFPWLEDLFDRNEAPPSVPVI